MHGAGKSNIKSKQESGYCRGASGRRAGRNCTYAASSRREHAIEKQRERERREGGEDTKDWEGRTDKEGTRKAQIEISYKRE